MSKKKSTIDENFWEETLPQSKEKTSTTTEEPVVEDKPKKKQRFTVLLPEEVIEKLKDCVYHTSGLTISDFAETAFTNEIEAREKIRGSEFPKRKGEIRAGRPMK